MIKDTTKFKPIVLGELTAEKRQFEMNVKGKISACNDLLTYVKQFIQVENLTDLTNGNEIIETNFLKEFERLFLERYKNDFPPISVQKMYELMNVSETALIVKITLINSYEIDTKIDTGEPLNVPNWNVQTVNDEQNKKYNAISKLLSAITEIKETGLTIYPAPICTALQGSVIFDFTENKLKVNNAFILGSHNRVY
ncbi:MAG: hypothetical protein EBR24_08140 [Flavobacteriia bacterium]|nr:hypothetical protein [Flavobacteriia bacterium]